MAGNPLWHNRKAFPKPEDFGNAFFVFRLGGMSAGIDSVLIFPRLRRRGNGRQPLSTRRYSPAG